MKNIFDFAYKELTNTAMWAWILASEQSETLEVSILSKNLKQKLGIPSHYNLTSISTNVNISPKDQIDILAKYRHGNEYIFLVIENKTRKDENVANQIMRYSDQLNKLNITNIKNFIFTFDLEIEENREDLLRNNIQLFTINDMSNLLEEKSYNNLLLQQYKNYIQKKQKFQKMILNSIGKKEGAMDFDFWEENASKNGILELFYFYLKELEKFSNAETIFSKERSVFLKLNKHPIISLHPKKSNCVKGLRIGFSETNIKKLGVELQQSIDLPKDFEHEREIQSGNVWIFSYFDSEEKILSSMESLRKKLKST